MTQKNPVRSKFSLTLGLAFALATGSVFAADAPPKGGSDYLLIVQEPAGDFARRSDPAKAGAYWTAFDDYGKGMAAAGVIRGGNVVQPPASAKTVSAKGTKSGPAEGSALLQGGYFVIHTASEAEALAWAAKCPCIANGAAVEVRAIIPRSM